uniref:Tetratricopeptide repeat protein 39B n=1 Tax=Rhabditophanes sp. KR3021 TaxID=114890 RepID=A0AC35UBL3_9BILA
MDKPAKSDALPNQKRNSIYEDAEEGTPELHSIFTLLETFKDTKLALHLFMNNKFEEAEEKLISKSDKSIYHALGFGVILFIKSMMTCERKDLETAAEACKKSVSIIEKYRAKNVFLNPMSWLSNSNKNLTDDQIHAELCYAETLLLKAVLAFFTDETFSSFIKGALKVNTCHSIYRECYKIINTTQWEERDAVVREQFEAGTRMGIGIFNMMISIMPAKILKLLEFCGFYGNKNIE